jgi:hypothetical protein
MKESTKKKLDSIDKSKIKVQESKDLLAKIEKALNNDKNEENQAKAEKLLDVFIAKAKAKNADIFKTEEPAKPKTPAQKKQVAQATKSKLDSLMDTIANDPLFKDFNSARRSKGGGKSDPLIDSERKARESGRRVSQKGWSNQYGKSKGGRRYYEYRENRIDRKAPTYGSKPWLEDGGLIHPSDKFQEKYSVIEIKGDGSRRVHNTFPDFETAMVFASLKRNVMPSNTRIVVEDEKGITMYRSFMNGGYMADGGQLTEEDYNNAFESKGYLDAEDFAKIDSTIEAKYLDRDRKSGVHEKFTKWWYNGGSKIAMAKYGNNEIEAWENAYEDFKDDYYKMAKGGKIVDQYDGRTPEDIWNNLTKSQRQHFLYDHRDIIEAYRGDEELKNKEIIEAYNSDWKGLDKDIKNRFANHTREGEYAKGGYMADGGKVKWQDVFVGDKALVIEENKMGYVIKPYGRRFHLKFPDGSEKTYSAEELEFFKDEEYAKGGQIMSLEEFKKTLPDVRSPYWGEDNIMYKAKYNPYADRTQYFKNGRRGGKPISIDYAYKESYLYFANKNAKKPTGDYTNRRDLKLIVIKNPNKSGSKDYLTIDKKDFLDGLHKMEDGGSLSKGYTYIKRADVNQVVYRDSNNKETIEFKPKNGFWVSKKALVDAGMNETKAKFDKNEVANQLTALSNEAWDKLSIQSGSEIYASDTLQQDLADEYQRLGINKIYKQLTKAERKKVSDVLTDENEHSLRNYLALRGYNGEAEYKNYVKMFEEGKAKFGYTSNWNPKNVDLPIVPFAEGGKIGFEGLSNKVAKNYEGKKVAPKYQDEYGKTYDKKEAKEVGNKVASKVYRQQLAKMEHGGELPEDLGKYFIKTRSTKVIPMSNIIPLRARAEGIANAEKYMKMAYDGKMDKRKPITLYKSQGKYRVYDGNSTYAVAKANGWENIWAEVIKNPNMNTKEKRGVDIFTKAKQIRKEGEAWKDALQRAKAMK